MDKLYKNVVKITCIWRGLTNIEQLEQYNKYVTDNNLNGVDVTKWEDNELGGKHDWFIFHNGKLTNQPKVIIDELVELNDIRTL